MKDTINCTYAPLSENKYLSTMIDSGQALTVRIMLPLGKYRRNAFPCHLPLAFSASTFPEQPAGQRAHAGILNIPATRRAHITACYWAIVTLIAWVLLSGTVKLGYLIRDLDSIRRHMYFAVLEASVLCVTLFGNVLSWMAFGLGRGAYMSVKRGGGMPKSGQAMEV